MKKILAVLVAAATVAGASVATSGPALAWHGGWHGGGWHGGGWGWGAGGFVAGALVGSALASSVRLRLLSVRILSSSLLRASLRVAALVERLRLGTRLRLSGRIGISLLRLAGRSAASPKRGRLWCEITDTNALSAPNFRQIVELQCVRVRHRIRGFPGLPAHPCSDPAPGRSEEEDTCANRSLAWRRPPPSASQL